MTCRSAKVLCSSTRTRSWGSTGSVFCIRSPLRDGRNSCCSASLRRLSFCLLFDLAGSKAKAGDAAEHYRSSRLACADRFAFVHGLAHGHNRGLDDVGPGTVFYTGTVSPKIKRPLCPLLPGIIRDPAGNRYEAPGAPRRPPPESVSWSRISG